MNQDLAKEYERIAVADREAVLQNDLVFEKRWGNETFCYMFQVRPTSDVLAQLTTIQEDLKKLEPEALLMGDPSTLHISVKHIIAPNDLSREENEKIWDGLKDQVFEAIEQTSFPTVDITYTKLIPTKGAIILVAEDEDDSMTKLREAVSAVIPMPSDTQVQYVTKIIHTTIARYQKSFENPQAIVEYCDTFNTSLPMHIDRLYFLHEKKFPTLEADIVKEIPLS